MSKLNKSDCKIISEMNRLYSILYNVGIKTGNKDIFDKLYLNRVLVKNFEEQRRGFLKSELPYKKASSFFISECRKLDFVELRNGVSKILLDFDL